MKKISPLFARLLEAQTVPPVKTGVQAGGTYVTLKYPSDKDETQNQTLKYPSDGDEQVSTL